VMRQDRIRKEGAISDSFVKAAKSDFNSARILLKNGEYSNSLYHSQQAIEKILKAMLALNGDRLIVQKDKKVILDVQCGKINSMLVG
jgi:HEPN domain-containing protein